MVAVLLLSIGVGASTAAFALANVALPHSAPFISRETTVENTSDFSSAQTLAAPVTGELRDRISDTYESSSEAAGDAMSAWSDAASEVSDVEGAGGGVIAVALGAGALALLVACTRAASRSVGTARARLLVAFVALGALALASLLGSALGLPALGLRAVAFAVAVTIVATRWARVEPMNR